MIFRNPTQEAHFAPIYSPHRSREFHANGSECYDHALSYARNLPPLYTHLPHFHSPQIKPAISADLIIYLFGETARRHRHGPRMQWTHRQAKQEQGPGPVLFIYAHANRSEALEPIVILDTSFRGLGIV